MVEEMREVYIELIEQAEEDKKESNERSGHVSAERTHPPYLFTRYVLRDERATKDERHDV